MAKMVDFRDLLLEGVFLIIENIFDLFTGHISEGLLNGNYLCFMLS